MPKLPNVTMEDIKSADRAGDDWHATLADLTSRIEKGYSDEIENPVSLARSFLAVSRLAAEMASLMLIKGAMQEQKAEYAAELQKLARKKPSLGDMIP